jgi:hypothetical protein
MEIWVHIAIGTLTIETGAEMAAYSPDLVNDLWNQARKGFADVLDAASERGLVQVESDAEDIEDA